MARAKTFLQMDKSIFYEFDLLSALISTNFKSTIELVIAKRSYLNLFFQLFHADERL